MAKSTVYDCSIIELPKIENRAGNITPIHGGLNVPFEIKRVFYSYDIPGGEARGACRPAAEGHHRPERARSEERRVGKEC